MNCKIIIFALSLVFISCDKTYETPDEIAEIEMEVSRAREELRKQVSILAIAGAEKILQRSIDASAHADILDSLVAEL